jgi:hypothetical protein
VVFIYLALRRRLSSFLSIWRSLPTFSLPLQQDIPSASPFSRSHFLFLLLLLLLFYKSSSFSSSLRPRRLLFSHGHYACDPLSASIPLTVLVSSSVTLPPRPYLAYQNYPRFQLAGLLLIGSGFANQCRVDHHSPSSRPRVLLYPIPSSTIP